MSVKHGLLAVLNRRSMHGYELRKELVDGLRTEWNVNYGQATRPSSGWCAMACACSPRRCRWSTPPTASSTR